MPFVWFREASDPDSAGNMHYWTDYAARLNIHGLIFCETDRDSIQLSSWQAGLLKNFGGVSLEQVIDETVLRETADETARECGLISTLPKVLQPPASNRKYWNGRYWALIDSFEKSIEYYKQIPDSMLSPVILLDLAESRIGLGEQRQIAGQSPQLQYLEAESLLDSTNADSVLFRRHSYLLARLRTNQGAWSRAEQSIRPLLKDNPDPGLLMLVSRMHPDRIHSMGFRDRKQLYEKAMELNPACVSAYIALGDWYYFHQRVHDAESVYRELLTINPRSYDGLLALGKIYLYRGETLNLIHVLERVREFYPGRPEVLYNLGIAYFNQNELSRAAQLFQTAAELYHYPDAYYYLGAVFLKQGNYKEAIEAFRQRIALRKGIKDAYADEAVKQLYRLLHDPEFEEAANHADR